MIAIAISATALLFAISGFILGLLGFIQARASSMSTHTVQQVEAPQQADLSQLFGAPTEEPEAFSVSNDKLEETLLKGLE